MKKISTLWYLFLIFKINAQTPNCTNGTNTNPNSSYVSPNTTTFKRNTFNWRQSSFPVLKPDVAYAPFLPLGTNPLYSPFYSTQTYLQYIAGQGNSDFKPERGWELIKQDFGYFYNSSTNQWNGSSISSTQYNSTISYFILYNKYSSKLRILATTPRIANGPDKIAISLRFIDPRPSVGKDKNLSNYTNYKPSGLFAHAKSVATVLDQPTTIDQITSYAAYPQSTNDFFFADFQLAYDPCICVFESALVVEFATLFNANITMTGKLLGVNTTMANIASGKGSLHGDDPTSENFYSQFFDDGTTTKGVVQTYDNMEDLENAMETTGGLSATVEAMDDFLKMASVASIFYPGMKEGVEAASGVLDYLTAFAGEKVEPTAIMANMELSGNVSYTSNSYGWDFRIAVPGSKNAQYGPEYTVANSNGPIPNYPMYNETPGLFALLETPHLKRRFKGTTCSTTEGNVSCNNQITLYKLDNATFKFAFNPIVNESKTKIDAAIEVNGKVISVPGYSNKVIDNAHFYQNNGNFELLRTDFFPLGCIQKVVVKEKSDFSGVVDRFVEGTTLRVNDTKAFIILNIYYVFNVDAYGKEHFTVQTLRYPLIMDATGDDLEADANFSKLKDVPTDAHIGPNGYNTWLGPGISLSGNVTTFSHAHTIYSKGTITIEGELINTTGTTIKIIAQNGFIISPTAIINPGFELKTGEIQEYFCEGSSPVAQRSTPELTTYCSSNTYQANNLGLMAPNPRYGQKGNQQNSQELFNCFVYPNPFSSTFMIDANSSDDHIFFIEVLDIKGAVISKEQTTNSSNLLLKQIDLSGYSDGIYFVKIYTSSGLVKNQKLVKISQ